MYRELTDIALFRTIMTKVISSFREAKLGANTDPTQDWRMFWVYLSKIETDYLSLEFRDLKIQSKNTYPYECSVGFTVATYRELVEVNDELLDRALNDWSKTPAECSL